jgi:hypothetical protein
VKRYVQERGHRTGRGSEGTPDGFSILHSLEGLLSLPGLVRGETEVRRPACLGSGCKAHGDGHHPCVFLPILSKMLRGQSGWPAAQRVLREAATLVSSFFLSGQSLNKLGFSQKLSAK